MRRVCFALLAGVIFSLGALGCGDGGSACGDCDDGIPCTSDACDAASGQCQHTPDDALCGVGFVCDPAQGCVPAAPCETNADCDDHNPCTIDVCGPSGCSHENNSLSCDDGDACTIDDVCSGGVCGGTPRQCEDGNPCTDDDCDPASGCTHVPNDADCDDGNACTTGDTCSGGSCIGTLNDCDDGNPCTSDSCDPDSGCAHENNSASCDDGDACTTGDTCSGGSCSGSPRQCEDGNPCTDDSCDPASGCVFVDNTAPCDDGNPCTEGDTCSGGVCVGGTNICDCQNDADCAAFEDGNPCNGTLHCVDNQCQVDPATVIVCDPSSDTPCSHNTCDPVDGSCHMVDADDGTACDDGDECTVDTVCSDGACIGDARVCDDDEPCTDDSCDSATGCVFTPNDDACDDGDPCTSDDVCNNGSCVGVHDDCDDGNPCTSDSCIPGVGCDHVHNTEPCDDGDPCTDDDTCGDGACQPGQEICCTGGVDDDGDGATDCDDAGCAQDPACISYDVDWCRLHHPAGIQALEGSVITVYGHLHIGGLTDQTSGVDEHPDVIGAVGWGPDGSQPDGGGWTWQAAAPNPLWDDASATPPEPGNDEYMAELTVPAAAGSPYDYAYRFSPDGGASWTYCDLDRSGEGGADGSADGYAPADAGEMEAESSSFQVDWCRLHSPAAIAETAGTRVTVYGHLNIAGLTDQSSGNDPHADVLAELGWGPDGSQPDAGWNWQAAAPNPAWTDGAEPGNDEYMADLLVPADSGAVDEYDYAYRFSADGGANWTLCDLDRSGQGGADGSADGYVPADAGALDAQAGDFDASNWGFEEDWTAGDAPPDFLLSSPALVAAPEFDTVALGDQACRLSWATEATLELRAGWQWQPVEAGVPVTLHLWLADADPAGSAQPVLEFDGTAEPGAAGGDGAGYIELTHTASAPASDRMTGLVRLQAEAGWDGDASLVVDAFDLTRPVTLAAPDGELDAWAGVTPAAPYQLIDAPHPIWLGLNDQGVLTAATDRPVVDQADAMLFVWVGGADPDAKVVLPWDKTGQIAAPLAGGRLLALIQEADSGGGGYCEWRVHDGSSWTKLSEDCAGASVLEGTVDVAALLGVAAAELPAELACAMALINTGDAGDMWALDQTPPCQDCVNDDLDWNETLPLHRAGVLLGRLQ